VAIPTSWYGAVYEPNDIEVVRRRIKIRKLSSRLDGMTAVQISDLHLNQAGDDHSRMVSMVKALKPDVIFFTGDLVNNASAVDGAVDIFGSLEARAGIWAVLGNSDHSSDVAETMPIQLKAAKVNYLRNASAQLEDGLWLIGVDDPASANEDLETALTDVPDGAPRILLAHSPDIATSIQKRRFDLILAGHTHGGQINLPILNGAWLLDGPSHHYVQGLYDLDGSPLYVNRGIGMAKLPVRAGARPEITHFTFEVA
jgi:uncharacterized protein